MNVQHETKTSIETLNEFMEWVQKLESGEYLFRGLSSTGYDIMASAYLRRAYNNRSIVYRTTGDYQAAVRDCDKAIEIKPDDAAAYNNRGVAKFRFGMDREAEQDFQTALHLTKNAGDEKLIARVERCLREINRTQEKHNE